MHDALDTAPPSRHPAVRPPACMPWQRGRRRFQREAFDDWIGARCGDTPRH